MKNYDERTINGAWLAPVGGSRKGRLFGLEEFLPYKSLQLRLPQAA